MRVTITHSRHRFVYNKPVHHHRTEDRDIPPQIYICLPADRNVHTIPDGYHIFNAAGHNLYSKRVDGANLSLKELAPPKSSVSEP